MAARQDGSDHRRARDLAKPLRWLVGAMFATIVILTISQVFFRFALDSPLVWSEELSRLLLVWVTFIGAAVVAWDGRHLVVDVLFIRMPARLREIVRWSNLAITVAFLAILGWSSIELVKINHLTELGALALPGSVVRLPATVGGFLILAFVLLRRFYRLPREQAGQDPDLLKHDPL